MSYKNCNLDDTYFGYDNLECAIFWDYDSCGWETVFNLSKKSNKLKKLYILNLSKSRKWITNNRRDEIESCEKLISYLKG